MISTNKDKFSRSAGCESTWIDQMYAACEALSVSEGGVISALSVTIPRAEGLDCLAQIEFLTAGMGELYHLEVTVEPRERSVTVRFAPPSTDHNSARVPPQMLIKR